VPFEFRIVLHPFRDHRKSEDHANWRNGLISDI